MVIISTVLLSLTFFWEGGGFGVGFKVRCGGKGGTESKTFNPKCSRDFSGSNKAMQRDPAMFDRVSMEALGVGLPMSVMVGRE
jgi:hypothetical protein